ncbi:alpha/beta family hydrolase [Colwellia sp. MEBiC06753]
MTSSVIIQHAKTPKANVLFAHGAGADKSSDFIVKVSDLLVEQGISVIRFNFPYMDKRLADGKRRPPDRMPKLLDCFIDHINQTSNDLPLFIGGKSMGSRVAAMLTSDMELPLDTQLNKSILGTFCLGYPFHPIGKPENLRLEPLTQRDNDILIVQGERDKLGDEIEIAGYQLPELCKVNFLPDGDHDLKPRVKSGFNYSAHIKSAADAIVNYINEKLANA